VTDTPKPSAATFDNTPQVGFGFGRALIDGEARMTVVSQGQAHLLADVAGSQYDRTGSLNDLLEIWDETVDLVEKWQARGAAVEPLPVTTGAVLTPVSPGHVFQAAANYRKHVIDLMVASPRPEHVALDEAGRRAVATRLMDERAGSGVPVVFSGLTSSLTAAYADVVIPHITQQCDWELELAAVIGRPSRYLTRSSALDFVAGYTIVNDITMRDRIYPSGDSSRGADWLACKGSPTFLPVGPIVVPARFVADPMDLTITLLLNGDVMQNESTSDMIYDLPRLLEHASTYARLDPGDILLTGSPAGNGVHHGRFLRAGDVMDGQITGLGAQRTPVVDEPPAVTRP
jgi:2,4-didehydro-3-deoxy-L-rhamnonate hydrolase